MVVLPTAPPAPEGGVVPGLTAAAGVEDCVDPFCNKNVNHVLSCLFVEHERACLKIMQTTRPWLQPHLVLNIEEVNNREWLLSRILQPSDCLLLSPCTESCWVLQLTQDQQNTMHGPPFIFQGLYS